MEDNRSDALFKAVLDKDFESVKGLLDDLTQTEKYDILNKKKKDCGSTAVHYAVEGGLSEIVKYMLNSVSEEYIDRLLTIQNKEGNTAIHWVAVYRRTEIMECIMDTVPCELIYKLLTIQNGKGYTPLHRVANFGDLEIMRCIVDFIAKNDPKKLRMIQCAEGNTAVHIAVDRGYANVIECILSTISKEDAYDLLKIKNRNGLTAVHLAAHKDGIDALTDTMQYIAGSISPDDMLKLLMIKSETGQHTVVHFVAFTDETKKMECLLDHLNAEQRGTILDSRNVNDLTPLAVAQKCGIRKMSSCIESYLQKTAGTYVEPPQQHSSKASCLPETMEKSSTISSHVHFNASDDSDYETESSAASTPRSQSPNVSDAQSGLSTTKSAATNIIPDDNGYGSESSAASTPRSQSPNVSEAQRDLFTQISTATNIIPDDQGSETESSAASTPRALTPNVSDAQSDLDTTKFSATKTISDDKGFETESLASTTPRSLTPKFTATNRIPDNEQTVEEQQHKIAKLEASLSEEIKKREEAEQQLVEVREELTQNIAELTSQNTTLENSLEEEHRKREKTEQQAVEVKTPWLAETMEKLPPILPHVDFNASGFFKPVRSHTALPNPADFGVSDDKGFETESSASTTPRALTPKFTATNRIPEFLGYELNIVRNKEGSSEEDSEGEDESALEEFLKSCAIENEYKPIPPHLIHLIYSQCRELNLECVVISQSTEDWKHLLIDVVNPDNIDLQLDEVLKQNPDFIITVENIKDPPKQESDVGDGLQVKQKIKNRGEISWLPGNQTSRCELIVKTEPTDRDNQHRKFAFYAVVPAHLVMTKDQKNRASKPCSELKGMLKEIPETDPVAQPDDAEQNDGERTTVRIDLETAVIAEIRLEVEQLTSRVRRSIQIHNERDPKYVDLQHPPLFCYRQWFYQAQKAHVGHLSPNLPQSRDPCPAARCSVESQKVVCHHIFTNDIALLPLEENYAVYLQGILETSVLPVKQCNIVPIEPLTVQQLMEQNAFTIRVKNLEGTTRPPIPEYSLDHVEGEEQRSKQSGIHLTFKLNKDSDLEKGDCGAIVYLVSKKGVHRPIGMYIGKIIRENVRKGFEKYTYKAIVLYQAFKDLQEDYPHHISQLTPFRLNRQQLQQFTAGF